MIYLYGVIDDSKVSLAGLTGHEGAPLVSIPAGRVAGVASQHRQFRLADGDAALWAHNRVVDGLLGRCTVAPARFGSTVADPERLRLLLMDQEPHLRTALARVRGKVELALRGSAGHDRAAGTETEHSSGPPGRHYLAQLRGDDPSAALQGIHSSLSPFAVHSIARFHGPSRITAAYLVDLAHVERFAAAVGQLAATHADVALSLTGPWAPFSFVEGPELSHG